MLSLAYILVVLTAQLLLFLLLLLLCSLLLLLFTDTLNTFYFGVVMSLD